MTRTRRQKLLSWLPAAILLVIIAGVVFTTIAVQNSWWAEDRPVASSDQKASDGSSMLSDAGLDYVNVEGVLRVRIGPGALPTTQVGLGADEEKSGEFRRPVRAVIAAGDEVYVIEDVETMRAAAKDGKLTSLTLGVGQALPWSSAVGTVQGLASEFGWDQDEIASWQQQVSDFTRENTEGIFTAEVTSTDAAQVTGTLAFDRSSGNTTLSITFAPVA
ncbi:hypothetical protein [Microbacterium sp. BK668]|uniref:hypothetical protein n=1 Tax=Microbacterium sp. BK668 TaxID=2512118 RepID=UPI00105EE6E5|nr:hypothetical protein [Microbacterium sp. BK668]TDN92177.1 hypothetical protein EV279_1693 [Microbacterium sp. BK668]